MIPSEPGLEGLTGNIISGNSRLLETSQVRTAFFSRLVRRNHELHTIPGFKEDLAASLGIPPTNRGNQLGFEGAVVFSKALHGRPAPGCRLQAQQILSAREGRISNDMMVIW